MHSMTQSRYYHGVQTTLSQVTIKTDINNIQCCLRVENTIVSIALRKHH